MVDLGKNQGKDTDKAKASRLGGSVIFLIVLAVCAVTVPRVLDTSPSEPSGIASTTPVPATAAPVPEALGYPRAPGTKWSSASVTDPLTGTELVSVTGRVGMTRIGFSCTPSGEAVFAVAHERPAIRRAAPYEVQWRTDGNPARNSGWMPYAGYDRSPQSSMVYRIGSVGGEGVAMDPEGWTSADAVSIAKAIIAAEHRFVLETSAGPKVFDVTGNARLEAAFETCGL